MIQRRFQQLVLTKFGGVKGLIGRFDFGDHVSGHVCGHVSQILPRKRTSTSRRYINLASILSQSAFKSRLCLFCFCDFVSSSHSLSCVASLLVVSLRHLQVEVCDFFFCLFVKGLDWLRDCVANGIIGVELRFNLKLGIYIFFFVTKRNI